jgi:hypothetical protein
MFAYRPSTSVTRPKTKSDAILQFVSVTQQFNTTSSMGRLTLNVLLSFAQFEREVRLGLKTKRSTTTNGVERGGKPFSRGHIHRLLSNPIYTGRIAHKGQLYPGQDQALIANEIWTAVRSET